MDKTRISFYGLCLFFLLTAGTGPLRAQKMQMVKGYCGFYYTGMEDLFRQKQAELDFYQFRPGQLVASIGAQCSHWEAAFAAASDSLHFYLQDIDTVYFNTRQSSFAWRYYDSLRGAPMSSTYQLVRGTEEATGLPVHIFDKILIINSFHEFTQPEIMLADIAGKLKDSGTLYIDEAAPRKSGQKHGICKKTMLLPEELIRLLEKNGYVYKASLNIDFRVNRTYRKIYAFQKK